MSESVIIAWTPTNWVTVFLMVLGGFLLIKVATLGFKTIAAKAGGAPSP